MRLVNSLTENEQFRNENAKGARGACRNQITNEAVEKWEPGFDTEARTRNSRNRWPSDNITAREALTAVQSIVNIAAIKNAR